MMRHIGALNKRTVGGFGVKGLALATGGEMLIFESVGCRYTRRFSARFSAWDEFSNVGEMRPVVGANRARWRVSE